ncbi:MAG TPA: histidine kinase [Kribbella sp.]
MGWNRIRWGDVLVPAALALVGTAELASTRPERWGWGAALEWTAACLLTVRRRWTVVTATAAVVVLLQMPWIGPQLDEAATPILFCSVASYALARWCRTVWEGLAGLAVVLLVFWIDYHFVDSRQHNVGDVVFVCTLAATPFVLGRMVRKLAEQATQLAQQQELIRREAVRDERDRIARELHDIVAHSVSAMVVQATVAADVLRTDPDVAEAALDEVAAAGRTALGETGRLLHLMRDDNDELGLHPAPGLHDLDDLLGKYRRQGLQVQVVSAGQLAGLPTGVDTSAYRIVQEALTNALRHSPDRAVTLVVRHDAGRLTIEAENRLGYGDTAGSGLGLIGMAERIGVLGGTLKHGATGDGRFLLAASLPLIPGAES